MPDKYWDPEKGEVRVKALVDGLTGTQTELRNRKEQLAEEIRREMAGERPKSVDEYQITQDGLGIELPPGISVRLDGPELEAAKSWALEAGIAPKTFEGLAKAFVSAQVKNAVSPANELAKLGPNATDRVQRIDGVIGKLLADAGKGPDDIVAFRAMVRDAKSVEIFETMLAKLKPAGPTGFDAGGDTLESLASKRDRLMASKEYFDNRFRQDAVVREVETLSKRISELKGRR